MSVDIEQLGWRELYVGGTICQLVDGLAPNEEAIGLAQAGDIIFLESQSAGGKGYHGQRAICLGEQRNTPILKAVQIVTRDERPDEVGGRSAYTHLDIRDQQVRDQLETDLAAGNYLQAFVKPGKSEINPDPDGPPVPMDLYAIPKQHIDPDHPTLIEMIVPETNRLLKLGIGKKAFSIICKSPHRWVGKFYDRENGFPSNFDERIREAIAANELIRDTVEAEWDLPMEAKTRVLGVNDYGEDDEIPAYVQLLLFSQGRYNAEIHKTAYDESGVMLRFLQQIREGTIRMLDARIVEPPPEPSPLSPLFTHRLRTLAAVG